MFGLASEKDGYANYPGGKEALDETLAAFAREGLRTLVLAQRILTEKESDAFRKQWRAAETAAGAGVDRKALMAEAAATVERDLQIVGATAIEDKLQEGAPDCIAELAEAGIKLWVLTGDKVETCVEIKLISRCTRLTGWFMHRSRRPSRSVIAQNCLRRTCTS